jgi:hypothetical protein
VQGRFLSFAALFTLIEHARMPLIIFGVVVAEPLITFDAMDGRRKVAWFVHRRHSLAYSLGRAFLLSGVHHRTHPRVILHPLCEPGRNRLGGGRLAIVESAEFRVSRIKKKPICKRMPRGRLRNREAQRQRNNPQAAPQK